MKEFNDLLKHTGEFVGKQVAEWDHAAWTGLLADMQRKGYDVSVEMQSNIGLVLESLKRIYLVIAQNYWQEFYLRAVQNIERNIEITMFNILDQTVNFIEQTKGLWDHNKWELFLKNLSDMGITLNKDVQFHIGTILESAKEIYEALPSGSKNTEEIN